MFDASRAVDPSLTTNIQDFMKRKEWRIISERLPVMKMRAQLILKWFELFIILGDTDDSIWKAFQTNLTAVKGKVRKWQNTENEQNALFYKSQIPALKYTT